MDKDWNQWGEHVLAELKRFNKEHAVFSKKVSKLDDRLDKYNEVLVRNTVSLEEHIKRTNLLEKKIGHVEREVGGLREHVSVVKSVFAVFQFFGTVKGKMLLKWMVLLGAGAASYFIGLKDWIANLAK